MIHGFQYEEDEQAFPADAYTIEGHKGIAWYVDGWEIEPDADTVWTGMLIKTGKVIAHMVGDDLLWRFDPEDVKELDPTAFCRECGQIGCTHGAYPKEEAI